MLQRELHMVLQPIIQMLLFRLLLVERSDLLKRERWN